MIRRLLVRVGAIAGLSAILVLHAPHARAADAQTPGQGVRYLYLIRHGMYDRDPHADDRIGNGLDSLGKQQARIVGERLSQLPIKMTTLVSSDFTRARETGAIIGRILEMTPVIDSLIHECTPPNDSPSLHSRPEEMAACTANLEAAWAKYARPSPDADRHDVLVCHGNVIRWFVCRTLGLEPKRWTSMEIGNASLTVIAVRPDSTTRLVMFSDVGHLAPATQTWTSRGVGWARNPAR